MGIYSFKTWIRHLALSAFVLVYIIRNYKMDLLIPLLGN